MSWIYSEQDYFGIVDDNYDSYEIPKRNVRGNSMQSNYGGFSNQKILIAGCGFGYLVHELMVNHGFNDVWGFDASEFGVSQRTRYSAVSDRILLGDVLVSQNMNSIRQSAGLRGNQRFRAVITEDLLPCMANESEVQTALANLRNISQDVAHVISIWPEEEQEYTYRHEDGSIRYLNGDIVMRMPGFLWWTKQEWIDVIGTSSEWIFTPSMIRIQ